MQNQATALAKNGELNGALIIPNAAVPVEITVDLRANRIDAKATISAPTDRRASARVTWLLNQMKAAPPTLQVVANVARAKSSGRSYALSSLLEDPKQMVDTPNVDIRSFTLTLSQTAGTKRGQGKGSFVGSVTALVSGFYDDVAQPLKAWSPPAPKPKSAPTADAAPGSLLPAVPEPEPARPFALSVTTALEPGKESTVVEGLPAPANSDSLGLAIPSSPQAAASVPVTPRETTIIVARFCELMFDFSREWPFRPGTVRPCNQQP